jgi:hypothetical protein
MELVDIYNDKHEKLNYTKGRKELSDGEFRLSCFVWIILAHILPPLANYNPIYQLILLF